MNFIKSCTVFPLLILGLAASGFAELKFVPMLDANLALNSASYDAQYAQSRVDQNGKTLPTNQNSSSQNSYFYFSPNLAFSEIPGLWITPVLEYEYNGANNLLQLDDESFLFAKRMDVYYLVGANYAPDKTWMLKLKLFGRNEYISETADENLYNGLYNYRDTGSWGEMAVAYRLGLPFRTKLGYKSYARRYPNYTNTAFVSQYEKTIGAWPADLPRDLREEDVNVGEYWLRNELSWEFIPMLTNLELHLKGVNSTQMPVIIEDGTFSHELRKDAYADILLEIPFLINQYHQLEFDYAYGLHASNQGRYDQNTYFYFPDYYNYWLQNYRLFYNFKFAFQLTGFSPKGSLSLSWQNKKYPARPARQKQADSSAVYNFSDPHWESTYDFGLTLQQNLWTKWFYVFLSLHFITQSSNTNVEDNASYNYKYNTFTLGTGITF